MAVQVKRVPVDLPAWLRTRPTVLLCAVLLTFSLSAPYQILDGTRSNGVWLHVSIPEASSRLSLLYYACYHSLNLYGTPYGVLDSLARCLLLMHQPALACSTVGQQVVRQHDNPVGIGDSPCQAIRSPLQDDAKAIDDMYPAYLTLKIKLYAVLHQTGCLDPTQIQQGNLDAIEFRGPNGF